MTTWERVVVNIRPCRVIRSVRIQKVSCVTGALRYRVERHGYEPAMREIFSGLRLNLSEADAARLGDVRTREGVRVLAAAPAAPPLPGVLRPRAEHPRPWTPRETSLCGGAVETK